MMLDFKACAQTFFERKIIPILDVNGRNSALQCGRNYVLFYAGPSDKVIKQIYGRQQRLKKNWALAATLAKQLNAGRIDDTPLFSYLMSEEPGKELSLLYGLKGAALSSVLQEIWHLVSARFAETDFKEAMTLICGADKDNSSFRRKEMSSMLVSAQPTP